MVQEPMQGQQAHEAARQIAANAERGLIIVDADGHIIWTDARLKQRLDGELSRLSLPLNVADMRATRPIIEGFVTTVDLEIGGETQQVCVIQQAANEPVHDAGLQRIVHSIEEVLAEPSWLTRTLIDKVKARLQAAAPNPRAADLKRLTAREREILGLVCEGCTDAEMADILNLSQNTVRNHLASLFRKIGVNRRSAAVIWARERAITKHDTLHSSALRDRASPLDGESA
jgi:DNA-binding CsgD family transcriptional regulator